MIGQQKVILETDVERAFSKSQYCFTSKKVTTLEAREPVSMAEDLQTSCGHQRCAWWQIRERGGHREPGSGLWTECLEEQHLGWGGLPEVPWGHPHGPESLVGPSSSRRMNQTLNGSRTLGAPTQPGLDVLGMAHWVLGPWSRVWHSRQWPGAVATEPLRAEVPEASTSSAWPCPSLPVLHGLPDPSQDRPAGQHVARGLQGAVRGLHGQPEPADRRRHTALPLRPLLRPVQVLPAPHLSVGTCARLWARPLP